MYVALFKQKFQWPGLAMKIKPDFGGHMFGFVPTYNDKSQLNYAA